jgi:integrase
MAASGNKVSCRICRTEHRPRHVRNTKHPQGIYHSVQADGTVVYEVRVQDGTGRRRFEVVGTRFDETKARLAELTHLVQKGGRIPSASLTVGDLLNEWWELKRPHVKERTQEEYARQIEKIRDRFGRDRVRDISGVDLQLWIQSLSASKVVLWAVLRQVFAHGVRSGALAANPCERVDPKARPRQSKQPKYGGKVYADAEIEALCAAAQTWLADIIRVARYSGMRLGEILALDWEHIDFERKTIRVKGTLGRDRVVGTTKSGKERDVPMLAPVEEVLREMRGISGAVFRNTLGDRRSVGKVSHAFTVARRRAGIEGGGDFHTLRHTFCSRLANSPQVPITEVSRILGHADLQTTMRYVHRVDDPTMLARIEGAA